MQQPSLFPDHPDTQPEPMLSDRQMVALIEVMSQIVKAFFERRFPRGEILQQSGIRLRSFCPENRMTCNGKVDRFILPRGWLSKGL